MGGICITYGEMRNEYKIFVGKPKEKRPCRKPTRKLEDNIRIDLRAKELEVVNWMHLV
jgi:hypothetical protein